MSRDTLQYLPIDRWSELQSAFEKFWPRGKTGYAVLETQKLWIKQGNSYGFKVYCPFGDFNNGMVALNEKNDFYEIIILCPNDNTEKLEEALIKTKLIDWKRRIIVPFAPTYITDCIERVINHVEAEIGLILPSESFVLDRETAPEDVMLPEDITFGQLSTEHIEIVDETWPHRYPTSRWYFELIINAKHGYGLFLKNTLISWVFVSESGTLLHMYTIEEHRKKGYAELLLRLVCNMLLKENRDVLAFCVEDNVKAQKLYKKAGFASAEKAGWCYIHNY